MRRRAAGLVAAMLAAAGAWATDERSGLVEQRRSIEAAHSARMAECLGRFAVTACQDAAREERRTRLAPVRERELALDAQERERRAAERRRLVEIKQREAAARPQPAGPGERPPREPLLPRAAADAAAPGLEVRSREKAQHAEDRSHEASVRAARSRERQAEGEQRQGRVAERLMERSLRGKPSEPLPQPASAPRR